MKKYDLYLFDFDGTLFDTFPSLYRIFKVAYESVGVEFKEEYTEHFSRIPLPEGYALLNAPLEKGHIFAKVIEKEVNSKESIKGTVFYDETLELFEHINKNNIKCGIVTSNNICHVKDVFDYYSINMDNFITLVGNRECNQYKPKPDPVLKAIELLENPIEKHRIVYVGDALNDCKSANAAGVDAVLIDRKNAFPESDEYIKISSLMELFS